MESLYHTTEFTGFLRTVIIILAVIYGLRFLAKLLAPWMMRKAQARLQNMAEEQMRQRGFSDNRTQNQRPEGSITVEKVKKNQKPLKTSSKSDEDYVDFEIIE